MLLKIQLGLTLLLLSTVLVNSSDIGSYLEVDNEFDDEEIEAQILERELQAIPESVLPKPDYYAPEQDQEFAKSHLNNEESSLSPISDTSNKVQEIETKDSVEKALTVKEEDALVKEIDNLIKSLPDRETINSQVLNNEYLDRNEESEISNEINNRIQKRSTRRSYFYYLLLNMQSNKKYRYVVTSNHKDDFPEECAKLSSSSESPTLTSCGNVTTFLGAIKWCRFSCKKGYRLVETTPEYEICGNATKYRWTYQLRGLQVPIERCIKGTPKPSSVKPCTTPECFATAAYYMNKIDFSVNPCDNFFDFACGRWMKETPFLPYNGVMQTYTVIRNRVQKDVSKLLSKPVTPSESDAVIKAKTVYKSCMNIDLIEKLDSQPLLELLQGYMAWPILDPYWDPKSFNFESTVAKLRGIYNNKVAMYVRIEKRNGHFVLQTLKGIMSLPLHYYIDHGYEYILEAYYSLMYDVALMLGADSAGVYKDVRDVRKFERELAYHKIHDPDYALHITLDELNQQVSGIDWLRMFEEMILSHPINGSTKITVWNHVYLKNLVKLIKNTDKRIVQNYLVWTNVKLRIKALGSRFTNRYHEFVKELYGKHNLTPRWIKCTKELLFTMKGATGKLFIDHYFSKAKKKAAKELFDYIRKGFLKLLDDEVSWMDNKTKSYARRKANAIRSNIGYNAHIYKNITYLDQETEHLTVNPLDYFGNMVNLLTNTAQNNFKLLGHTYNISSPVFSKRPTMVNAMNDIMHNIITLPAGEMQYPFYWGDRFPRMIQFGGIGTILGHELTHSFDNTGRKWGIHGQLVSWWTPTSLNRFKARVNCMQDQYSNYYWKAAGHYLDGHLSIGENIADNGGIRESYAGYHLWLKAHNLTDEGLEPSTGFTTDQMFFIAFANDRCAKYQHSRALRDVYHDVHSPGRYRVIGSLQNFDKFSQAYNCPVGSFMNPRHKCVIW